MTSLPRITPEGPVGIVIRSGHQARKPAVIWAYVWAADDDEAKEHWHNHVPVERAA
jgi:hypothetical protein